MQKTGVAAPVVVQSTAAHVQQEWRRRRNYTIAMAIPNRFQRAVSVPLSFVSILWIILGIDSALGLDLHSFSVYPRTEDGLIGILTMPLLHADFAHLASNSVPLLVLGFALYLFYPSVATRVLLLIYFGSGALVWAAARPSYHIGASGVVYGLIAYVFFSGVFRKDVRSIVLALITVFLYGGAIWGILPLEPGVSWEGHLFGGVVGVGCSWVFRKSDPPKKYDWEDEPPGGSPGEDDDWRYVHLPDGSRILKDHGE